MLVSRFIVSALALKRRELAQIPIRLLFGNGLRVRSGQAFSRNSGDRRMTTKTYALLLGRMVKSRTWVRMLDICIPFNCETKGKISAMN